MKTVSVLALASLALTDVSAQALQSSWFSNLSVRSLMGPNEPLIVGFTLDGLPGATADVFIRAVGPSLAVENPHPHPKVEVYAPTGQLLTWNDGWDKDAAIPDPSGRLHPVLVAQFLSGAFPLPRGSKDSAVLMTLGPGMQTLHVKPADGISQGACLLEIYLIGNSSPATIRLANLSLRAIVGPDRIVIAGLSMQKVYRNEQEARWVLVRAVGPTLAQFGVENAHSKPTIDVFTESALLRTTVNRWETALPSGQSGAPARERYFRAQSATGAFPLPAGSMDAADLLQLAPFSWTFHLKSGNGATGEVLFELYDVPQSAW